MTFEQYVRDIANRLGLASWELFFFDELPDDAPPHDNPAAGYCSVKSDSRLCCLWFNDHVQQNTEPTDTREFVIHEC
jgi:hypothetical protein